MYIYIYMFVLFLIVESVTCASYQILDSIIIVTVRTSERLRHLDYCNSSVVVVVVVGCIGLLVFILHGVWWLIVLDLIGCGATVGRYPSVSYSMCCMYI